MKANNIHVFLVSLCTKTIFWKMFSWENARDKLFLLCEMKRVWKSLVLRLQPCGLWRSVVWNTGIYFGGNFCLLFQRFWKCEAPSGLSNSVGIYHNTRRHIPPAPNPKLLYEYSQDTRNVPAHNWEQSMLLVRLAAKLLLTQKSTYTVIHLLLLVTVDLISTYPAGLHQSHARHINASCKQLIAEYISSNKVQ
jgi:hypothetical protein